MDTASYRDPSAMNTVAALHHAEERLTLALSAGRLGAWEFDVRTRRLTASPQCKANHGFAPEQDLQLEADILPAVEQSHRAAFVAAVDDAIATHGAFEIEVPHRWPDGSHHWLLVAGRMIDQACMVGVSQDITARRQVEIALRESERRYKEIVETANEGIWTLDADARITFVNRRMSALIGRDPAEMIGRYKWDFVFDEDVEAMRRLFERRRRGSVEELIDIRFRRQDGQEVWTLMSARPLHDADGTFAGALDLFTDVTERRRADQALRESEARVREALVAADRGKDEFLAVLGHELRNPLAPILTAVRLLQVKGPPDPELQKLRATILRQTLQLSRMVDDLLDVGRIINRKLRLELELADLRTVVAHAIETCAPLIEQRRHRLKVTRPELPIMANVDIARLVQVVSNVLTNAAKYMREGGEIDLRLGERDGMAVISVRDEGVGIAAEMLERVFDRFVQIETSAHRAQGGLGLGLALVKALVELHGGDVRAFSDGVGKGSEFVVRLPLPSDH